MLRIHIQTKSDVFAGPPRQLLPLTAALLFLPLPGVIPLLKLVVHGPPRTSNTSGWTTPGVSCCLPSLHERLNSLSSSSRHLCNFQGHPWLFSEDLNSFLLAEPCLGTALHLFLCFMMLGWHHWVTKPQNHRTAQVEGTLKDHEVQHSPREGSLDEMI